ncbi:MAG: MoxR family ATPase [Alphaproteobacteria bacterium]
MSSEQIKGLISELQSQIIGQEDMVKKMIIAMIAGGHVLLEGAPGLAKTKAIKILSSMINSKYNRVQFTPDLLPSDITGSEIFVASKGEFEFRQGPVFTNLLLADEVNRSPAKVQSALLEAMAERQVSIGGKRYNLPELFFVMATQNPIEHEGTYNLPEAQLDRFLMYVKIEQPNAEVEKQILKLVREENKNNQEKTFNKLEIQDILDARKSVYDVHCSDALEEYMVQLIVATRQADKYNDALKGQILFGASPRATIALDLCARINAWIDGRDFVTPADVHYVLFDVLRHRIILSFQAQAQGITTDDVIANLLKVVPLP